MEKYLEHEIGMIDVGYTSREDIEIDIAMDTRLNDIYNLGRVDALIEVRKKVIINNSINKVLNYGNK